MSSRVLKCHGWLCHRGMDVYQGDVLHASRLWPPSWSSTWSSFNWNRVIFYDGRCSCHFLSWSSTTCHGNYSRNSFGRGIFLRSSLSINSTSLTTCDNPTARCPITRPIGSCFSKINTNLPRNLRSRSLSLALLLEFIFYFEYQDY